jgi:hypothetical protein
VVHVASLALCPSPRSWPRAGDKFNQQVNSAYNKKLMPGSAEN